MTIPSSESHFGPHVPRRGNAFSRGLGRLLLRLGGWRVVGNPPDTGKFVVAAAPHTSNWDGIHFLCATIALGLDLHWVGKHTIFENRFGRLLRWMGGISVDRSAAKDFVDGVVDKFSERESLVIIIAPEGTRGPNARWKSGLYRIAHKAKVPISLGFLDYKRRLMGFGPSLDAAALSYPEALAAMREFYAQIHPKIAANFILPEPDAGS